MIFARQRATEWALRAIRRASWRSALIVFVAVERRPIGALLLADELRSDTPRAIRMLRTAGVARIVMVTGDRAAAAQAIGAALDLDAVLADRVPSDKVDAVRAERRLHPTIMVGDGINDAPALASAATERGGCSRRPLDNVLAVVVEHLRLYTVTPGLPDGGRLLALLRRARSSRSRTQL
jgi:high-affinity K+ transport system ATPase subunit B